jgi:hypothetical protein
MLIICVAKICSTKLSLQRLVIAKMLITSKPNLTNFARVFTSKSGRKVCFFFNNQLSKCCQVGMSHWLFDSN